MDGEVLAITILLFLPIYGGLFTINRRIGKYDEVCKTVTSLKTEVSRIWEKLDEVT
ncbi:MAG: hypothetical protein PHF64_11440 [Methanoregula sp.]|nr:hypothetical protein [Methanoregula sp.]